MRVFFYLKLGKHTMTLALFDLDHTLLNGDSDHLWGQFLVDNDLVDREAYAKANDYFYEQYKQGQLDIHEFCSFSFQPLTQWSNERLAELHAEFMQTVILPVLPQISKDLVQKHKDQGHTTLIITATNSFVTAPIAKELQVDYLLATEPKKVNGKYTTEIEGTPCFREGKVTRINAWLAENGESLDGSYFYSDSHNDLALLEQVTNPIATNPDEKLLAVAQERNWDVLHLHQA